jgi:hypothetical protein
MTMLVSDLMTNDRRWRELGTRSRAFLVQNHSLDSTAVAYQALIEQSL